MDEGLVYIWTVDVPLKINTNYLKLKGIHMFDVQCRLLKGHVLVILDKMFMDHWLNIPYA